MRFCIISFQLRRTHDISFAFKVFAVCFVSIKCHAVCHYLFIQIVVNFFKRAFKEMEMTPSQLTFTF